MRICFIAPANNYHTKKWAQWFIKNNHEVHIISFLDAQIEGVMVHYINTGIDVAENDKRKLVYLLYSRKVRKIIKSINPDIINAHYATSYGTVTALAGIHPYVLSVWGSDIYEFPNKSWAHKKLLKYSLKKADYLFSTSKAMADEASKYTNHSFEITPFGVDMELFNRSKRSRQNDDRFVIGTVKGLSYKYGIDTLLKGAAIVNQEHPEYNLEVRIAGRGKDEYQLKELAKELKIDTIVRWLGFISQEDAAVEWANMDIGIVVSSSSESFGVSAVECQASNVPVIISDVPGLEEATFPNESSLVIRREDARELADLIIKLYNNSKMRFEMGQCGRQYVEKYFEINKCFISVENIFKSIIKGK